jgi:hypothetical protein
MPQGSGISKVLHGSLDTFGGKFYGPLDYSGSSSYVTGGDNILAKAFGMEKILTLIGSVDQSGTYTVKGRPLSNGICDWDLVWLGGSNGGSGSSPVATELGVAANFELLAYSGITNTGNTVITGGDIGSFPTESITGFPPGVLTPPAIIDNADASAAQTALAAAIIYYQGLTPTLSGLSNLSTGGNGSTPATFTPGNYFGASSLTMPTGIILDAQGDPNAVFVFVAGSTINLASGQTVALINGAQAANVVFVAGSSYTSVATSTMNGNVLAVASITLGGGTLNGRALANTGAVTISAATAATVPSVSGSSGGEVAAGTNLSGFTVRLTAIGI